MGPQTLPWQNRAKGPRAHGPPGAALPEPRLEPPGTWGAQGAPANLEPRLAPPSSQEPRRGFTKTATGALHPLIFGPLLCCSHHRGSRPVGEESPVPCE